MTALRHHTLRRHSSYTNPFEPTVSQNKVIPPALVDLVPQTHLLVHHFDNHPASASMFEGTYLKCLLDSGSSGHVIGAENLPPHWQQWSIPKEYTWTSGGVNFKTHFDVRLE